MTIPPYDMHNPVYTKSRAYNGKDCHSNCLYKSCKGSYV